MKKFGPLCALALLLIAFTTSLHQVTRHRASDEPGVRTLRIGHWLIHAGMREALDAVIADYEKLHPDVRVVQNPVPIKAWPAWQRAQWTGGTTPDLMQLGKGTGEDNIARYYRPLGDQLDAPNPYNAGTPLETLPWRATFVDGLASTGVFYPSAGDVFGIPAQVVVLRLFYNPLLLREVTGSDAPPATIEALLALGPQVRDWSRRTGRPLTPLALNNAYGLGLFDQLSQSMTQRLARRIQPSRTLLPTPQNTARAHLDGRWSLDTPDVRRMLELWAEIAALAPPGYLQLQREDSLFAFAGGRALFYYAGTWDYAGLRQQSPFPVAVTRFPFPAAGEGRWGEFSLGPVAETEGGMECILGIANDSREPDLALDFLRFLTSHASARKMAALSQRIPSLIDVPVPTELEALRPDTEGSFPGLLLSQRTSPGGNAFHRFQAELNRLAVGPPSNSSATESFRSALGTEWKDAMARDLEAARNAQKQAVRQADLRNLFLATAQSQSQTDLLDTEGSLESEIRLDYDPTHQSTQIVEIHD